MMRESLLVMGDAPCLADDMARIDAMPSAVMAINRAGLRYLERIEFWCTYHPEKFWQEWACQRASLGGNQDYKKITDSDTRNIPISGSSTLLGAVWGLEHFQRIIIVGAPLDHDGYHQYRIGWENESKHLAGRVSSLSGWTKTFLEGLNHGA